MGSELIEYANVLHDGGVGSRAAADFRRARSGDRAFLRRAGAIDRLFLLRARLLGEERPGRLRRLLTGLLRRVRRSR